MQITSFRCFPSVVYCPVMQITSFRCLSLGSLLPRLCMLHLSDVYPSVAYCSGYADYIFQMFIHKYYLNFCVSHLLMKQLIYGHKKGVEIVSMLYPIFRSWRTYGMDKTIAPTPILLYSATLQRH